MCMGVLPACLSVHHVAPMGARRGRQVLWNWGYRWLLANHVGAGKLNLGPLKEQPVLLTAEDLCSPQPVFVWLVHGFCHKLLQTW